MINVITNGLMNVACSHINVNVLFPAPCSLLLLNPLLNLLISN